MPAIERLTQDDAAQVERLLLTDPTQNLFLLGFLDVHPMDRAWWYGVRGTDGLRGVLMLLPGRLAVPWCPDPTDAHSLGQTLQLSHRPCMLVGPRAACDAIWTPWAASRVRPHRWYDQRLYLCTQSSSNPEPVPGFRRATESESRAIAENSGRMEAEDLGHNPFKQNPRLHEKTVIDRIRSGRTWIIERRGEIVFQINVGTQCEHGCQVGGTYVPPAHRRRGLAKAGMRALCDRLLRETPRITLHVNEANTPAVRVYERAGFERSAPFRLATVKD